MSIKHSLRLRVALGIALLSIIVVSVHSIALYLATNRAEEEEIDRIITEEIEHLIGRHRANPGAQPPHTQRLSGYIVHSDSELSELPHHLRHLTEGLREVFVDGLEFHVAFRTDGPTRFYIAYDAQRHEQRMRAFKLLLVLGVAATAVLAMALGYWLARFLVDPVTDLAARVATLQPGAKYAGLTCSYVDDEVRRLAAAFDRYHIKMAEFVEREQQFTADVSHELRTPLTTIRTSCELLALDPSLGPDSRRRLDQIAGAARRMADLVRSLLFLARTGQPIEPEPVLLRESVDEACEPLRDAVARQPLVLDNAVDPRVVLQLDRSALDLILSNLIRNALDHADAGRIEVQFRERTLTIADTGRGIGAEELPHVFQRFYRGAAARAHGQGFGLGLALVKR
ncbi:MAG TPA: HAMP domain-containing sensor histidine kinase, partial [Burkholderiales bacterium]|nr:HAMP domain-containing sensor histidine kinase [Burkholderiales bacterium]